MTDETKSKPFVAHLERSVNFNILQRKELVVSLLERRGYKTTQCYLHEQVFKMRKPVLSGELTNVLLALGEKAICLVQFGQESEGTYQIHEAAL